jgi:periplasmic protein TonB
MSHARVILPDLATPLPAPAGAPRATLAEFRATARSVPWPVLALAAGLSVAAHLAAMTAFTPRTEVAVEGGAPAALAALGHAFEDFALGAQPVAPAAAPSPAPAQAAPAALAAATRTAPETALPDLSDPAALPEPAARAEAPTAAPFAAVPAAPAGRAARAEPARPTATAARDAPTVAVNTPDAASPRPQPRPDPDARRPVADETPAQPRPGAPAHPPGNASQSATRGAETGQADATAARTGTVATPSDTSGSAAASNYPGDVLRHLQRSAQVRVAARGSAVVGFTIGENGGLAAVAIERGSGSATLDQAALDHVRRAAPFPPPPPGAQRQFRYEFASR